MFGAWSTGQGAAITPVAAQSSPGCSCQRAGRADGFAAPGADRQLLHCSAVAQSKRTDQPVGPALRSIQPELSLTSLQRGRVHRTVRADSRGVPGRGFVCPGQWANGDGYAGESADRASHRLCVANRPGLQRDDEGLSAPYGKPHVLFAGSAAFAESGCARGTHRRTEQLLPAASKADAGGQRTSDCQCARLRLRRIVSWQRHAPQPTTAERP